MLNYLLRTPPPFFLPLCESWNSWPTSLWYWVYLSFVAVLPQLCFSRLPPSLHSFHCQSDIEAVFGVNAHRWWGGKKGTVVHCGHFKWTWSEHLLFAHSSVCLTFTKPLKENSDIYQRVLTFYNATVVPIELQPIVCPKLRWLPMKLQIKVWHIFSQEHAASECKSFQVLCVNSMVTCSYNWLIPLAKEIWPGFYNRFKK